MSDFAWATVTTAGSLASLRVQLDGDPAALPTPPHDCLVDPRTLAVGARVRCEWEQTRNGRRLVLHGATGAAAAAPVPAGVVVPFAGFEGPVAAHIPAGWLRCDGTVRNRADFPELFAAIGTRYGAGNGTTTFHLPNLIERVPVGLGGSGFAAGTAAVTGGSATHQHGSSQMVAQTGRQNGAQADVAWLWNPRNTAAWNPPANGAQISAAAAVNPTTGAGANNVTRGAAVAGNTDAASSLQPYVVMHYIIKT